MVVSNHRDAEPLVRSYGLEFRHIPVTPATKADAEAELMALHEELGIHLVVLARYMQVLSDDVCRRLSGQAINIHHSFLPSFKGAKPYHQAFDRGVKLIGATAHYVTADLDEGPIIEQDVIRVDHNHDQDQLVAGRPRRRGGRALARRALALRVAGAARRPPDRRLPLRTSTLVSQVMNPNRLSAHDAWCARRRNWFITWETAAPSRSSTPALFGVFDSFVR